MAISLLLLALLLATQLVLGYSNNPVDSKSGEDVEDDEREHDTATRVSN